MVHAHAHGTAILLPKGATLLLWPRHEKRLEFKDGRLHQMNAPTDAGGGQGRVGSRLVARVPKKHRFPTLQMEGNRKKTKHK